MNYRFRQPTAGTPVMPARDLLDAAERAFLQRLGPIRVGLNLPDNRPYEVIGPDGTIAGIQIEILTHLALALGIEVVPVVLPDFPAALQALKDRRVDMMATLGYEPTREPFVAYTLGTAPNPGAIIGRAADPRFVASPTLNGRRVAIERGYVAQPFVRRNWPEALVIDQPDTAAALGAVALGEDDFYVGSLLMAMDRIQRNRIQGLEVKRTLIYNTGQMHFGVRKDWPLLASAFSKGIAAMRAAPLPGLQAVLDSLKRPDETPLPLPMPLSAREQRQLDGRSVLRVGAVRNLNLLNEALPNGGHAGIASDYMNQVAGRLGVAVDVVPFDSVAQMLDALREGEIHLVPFLTRTPERERHFVYSAPYLEMPYFIVARSDGALYWSLDSLRGRRLALAAQHPLREILAQRYPDIRIVEAPSGQGAMDLVARGEAEAAVEVKLFANLRIQNDSGGRLRTVAQVDELPAQFHFATSQEAAGLVPLINRALADIGPAERDRMLRRWVAIDFQPSWPWARYLPWILALTAALALAALASLWWMRRLGREVRQRRLAEQRLSDVTTSLPGVVFQYTLGSRGEILGHYESPTVRAFLGGRLADGLNAIEALTARLSPEDARHFEAERRQALAKQQPFKLTVRLDDPPPAERWLHCEATAHVLADGRTVWTGYVVDVSSERALQARLLDAMQAKNLFVASASHELRGPLQVILLALQRLGEAPLPQAQRGLVRIADDATQALAQLVDDVLDLSRLEAGRLRLQPSAVDLPALLAQIVEHHRLPSEAAGLRLGLEVDERLPVRVMADALRLRQLLTNLIGNAIKYTPQGEVQVSARRLPSRPQGDAALPAEPGAGAGMARTPGDAGGAREATPAADRLVLVVRDTGIGIDPERQHALFEPFGMQHAPTEAPTANSTGLGLAICKRLVEAMQGRILLDSLPGRGTVVTVDLPLPPEVPEAEVPAAAARPDGPSAPADPDRIAGPGRSVAARVLLVDDDAVSRLLMSEALRRAGWQVTEAGHVQQALQAWRLDAFDLVISDHQMPDGDGLALLQHIAAKCPPGRRPRLVLCSGSRLDVQAAEAGLDAVLRKPVGAERLVQALSQVLEAAAAEA